MDSGMKRFLNEMADRAAAVAEGAKVAKDAARSCPSCGAVCRPKDRFCPSCGCKLED